jgi:hypothetical protein
MLLIPVIFLRIYGMSESVLEIEDIEGSFTKSK